MKDPAASSGEWTRIKKFITHESATMSETFDAINLAEHFHLRSMQVPSAPRGLEARFLAAYGVDAADPAVGSVSGKLLRPRHEHESVSIDSAGIYMTPSSRHLDRGSGVTDRGQYERPQFVFGASGAAALYRREMLEDVAPMLGVGIGLAMRRVEI